MIVYILDSFADSGSSGTGLFQSSSTFKSTHAVLIELGNLLLPANGNISRSLAQLGYQVSHKQPPLTNYDHRIVNLVADLRDGVRLAYIVELFLFSPQSHAEHKTSEDMTFQGLKRHVIKPPSDQPLSKHLKFPCIGRQQSMCNVQITFDALQGIPGLAPILGNVSAQDIVDGHREKSIVLLWALVGRWGLGLVVDMKELRREIRRTEQLQAIANVNQSRVVFETSENGSRPEQHIQILKGWHGQLRGCITSKSRTGRQRLQTEHCLVRL